MGDLMKQTACPECSKTGRGKSLAVYDDGVYCHECGYTEKDSIFNNNNKTITTKQKNKSLPDFDIKFSAIKSRNITADVASKYSYGVAEHKGKPVQVAAFYEKGKAVAYKIRTKNKDFKWFGNKAEVPALFGMNLFEPNPKLSITVCEGELDTLCRASIDGGKWPVVGLLDGAGGQGVKSVARAKEFLSGFKKVVFMFDGDEAGRRCAEECAKLLPGKARIAQMPDGEDVCSMVAAGRADEINQLEIRATSYRPQNIVTITDYTEEELYSKEAVGIPLPYPYLSNCIRGLKRGRLYTFCAGSGLGKSTLVKELGYHLMFNEHIRVGSVFLEQDDKEAMKDYIAMHCNIEAETFCENPQDADEELRKEAEMTIGQYGLFYKHFGSLDTDTLVNKIEYLMVAGECDFVILDHISMAVSGIDASGNERKDIDILMTKLRTLIQSTGKTIISVVHLKRPGQGRQSFNNGEQVYLSDLRGSAAIEQISDFVIALERDQFDEEKTNMTKLKVLKSRRGGKVGYADVVEYSEVTGRMTATENSYDK